MSDGEESSPRHAMNARHAPRHPEPATGDEVKRSTSEQGRDIAQNSMSPGGRYVKDSGVLVIELRPEAAWTSSGWPKGNIEGRSWKLMPPPAIPMQTGAWIALQLDLEERGVHRSSAC